MEKETKKLWQHLKLNSEEEFKEHILRVLNTGRSKEIVDKIGAEIDGKFYIQQNIFPVLEVIDEVFNLQKILADKFSFPNESERGEVIKKICRLWKKERRSYKNVYDPLYDEDQKALEDYLSLDAEIKELEEDVKQFGDEDSFSIAPLREELKEFLQPTNLDEGQKDSIISVFGEAIENAIEHGEKGKPGMIKPGDKIRISYGCDSEKIAIIVTDFYGTLKEETIEHHKNLSKGNFGIDTTRGMGIFIMNSIVDKLDYNIKEGEFTQLIAIYAGKK
ncbi:ATP-binding protein [bacterium]|nr:ATP-binding protein [bacterium]